MKIGQLETHDRAMRNVAKGTTLSSLDRSARRSQAIKCTSQCGPHRWFAALLEVVAQLAPRGQQGQPGRLPTFRIQVSEIDCDLESRVVTCDDLIAYGNRVQHDRQVGHAAGDWANGVETRSHGNHAIAAHASEGRFAAGDAAERRGANDRSAGLRTD